MPEDRARRRKFLLDALSIRTGRQGGTEQPKGGPAHDDDNAAPSGEENTDECASDESTKTSL